MSQKGLNLLQISYAFWVVHQLLAQVQNTNRNLIIGFFLCQERRRFELFAFDFSLSCI